jgi:hypothetical protein
MVVDELSESNRGENGFGSTGISSHSVKIAKKNRNTIMIQRKNIADSKNEFGNRLTTFVLTFPRIVLAEFNTHRMISKNSASSRAIPFKKMLKMVQENPFIPIKWMKDHSGMQGNEYGQNMILLMVQVKM